MNDAIYTRDGDWFVPTRYAGGPWSADAQHGGPPSALLARAAERHLPEHLRVLRMTVELLRPVGMVPHRVEVEVLRPGKRVQLIGCRLLSSDGEVARATALGVRSDDTLSFGPPIHDTSPPAPPETGIERVAFAGFQHFFADAIEVRYVAGGADLPGPATAWMRLRIPLVEGEEPTPLQRTVVVADTGNGISSELDFRRHVFINPDLTLYLHRQPRGEWICVDAETDLDQGTGLAQAALFDEYGRIGRSLQALYVDHR